MPCKFPPKLVRYIVAHNLWVLSWQQMQFLAAWATTLSITALLLWHAVSGLHKDSQTFLQSSSASWATPSNHCSGKFRTTTLFPSIFRLSTKSRYYGAILEVNFNVMGMKLLVI